MSKSVSNIEIERLYEEISNDYLNENFLGVYPIDQVNKFIMFEKMIPGKKYPFLISYSDTSDQGGKN